ncbi:ABC transporter substrate-binding protein [Microbacterium alcoholitolerans]|uniref:ABC transporter substrate-binding protein n=1 Tax=unclassified Microbacterium TaxID=2609290 RepID=UPI003D16663B
MARILRHGVLSVMAAGIAAITLTACAAGGGSAGAGGGDGGGTLRLTLANHGWTELVSDRIDEFEKKTGVNVEITTYGEEQLTEQYNVKLNAGDSSIDVMMYRPPSETRLFAQNGWLEDITDRAQSSNALDWGDFYDSSVQNVSVDDRVYGVPLVTEQQVLYYRKDLLEAAGIAVPKTLDELEKAAAALNKDGVYGFVARGKQTSQTAPYLHTFGADWTADDKATLDTPEAIEAVEYYGRMLREYGPPGVTNMAWPEAIAIFAQGKAAFYTDANVLYTNITDPAKSTVADTTGFAVIPGGPEGPQPYNVTSWGLAINPNSQQKDNAWKFIEWATSADMVLAAQQEGLLGARKSVWENPESLTGVPADLAEVTKESIAIDGGRDRPDVVQVKKASDIYLAMVTAGILGEDVKSAAKKANTELQQLLDEEASRAR